MIRLRRVARNLQWEGCYVGLGPKKGLHSKSERFMRPNSLKIQKNRSLPEIGMVLEFKSH